jgi:hypothetical protein
MLYITNSTEQSPSSEANSYSASQLIPHLLWKASLLCLQESSPLPIHFQIPDRPLILNFQTVLSVIRI